MGVLIPQVLENIRQDVDEAVEGRNLGLTTTYEDLWQNSTVMVWPSAAALPSIVSSNAADKGTPTEGTGIRTVRVFGLDSNYDEVEEDVTLNGTDAVALTKPMTRIQKIETLTTGSGLAAVGNIDISIGGNIQARIAIGLNNTMKGMWTIPKGQAIRLNRIFANSFDQKKATFRVQYKSASNNIWYTFKELECQDFHIALNDVNRNFGSKIDFRIQGKVATGSGTATGGFDIKFLGR